MQVGDYIEVHLVTDQWVPAQVNHVPEGGMSFSVYMIGDKSLLHLQTRMKGTSWRWMEPQARLSELRRVVHSSGSFHNFECHFGFRLGTCPDNNDCLECTSYNLVRDPT